VPRFLETLLARPEDACGPPSYGARMDRRLEAYPKTVRPAESILIESPMAPGSSPHPPGTVQTSFKHSMSQIFAERRLRHHSA
jgi:hypothetical protein